ncbi:hypothetical protein [Kitasatospora sp. NPDC059327]|uniref:hypothetical protein n=1 Tax=Kitasatospora sp. NPDC059327 TaxID=3346803 RepID=UPI003697B05D
MSLASLPPGPRYVIALDAGGTAMKGAIIGPDINQAISLHRPTPRRERPPAVLATIGRTIDDLHEHAREEGIEPVHTAVAVPSIAAAHTLNGHPSTVDGWAGEIGHLTIDPHDPPRPCGDTGCPESIGLHDRAAPPPPVAARPASSSATGPDPLRPPRPDGGVADGSPGRVKTSPCGRHRCSICPTTCQETFPASPI